MHSTPESERPTTDEPSAQRAPAHLGPTLLGRPNGELVLRVLGPQQRGRIVRLQAAKCTLGSGPHCTLRLRARGVRPVHCLILRGNSGAYIRRWHADTCLNDAAFTESFLKAGDRLHVGPIELEIIETGTPGAVSKSREQLGQSVSTPTDIAEQLQTTTDELNAALAEAKAELERTQQQYAHDQNRLQTVMQELEQTRQQLTAANTAYEQEKASWEQQRTELRQQIDKLTAENNALESRQADLLSKAEQAAETLRAETERLVEQLKIADQTIQEKTCRIAELESRIQSISEVPACNQTQFLSTPANAFPIDENIAQAEASFMGAGPNADEQAPAAIPDDNPRSTLALGPDFQPMIPESSLPALPDAHRANDRNTVALEPSPEPQLAETTGGNHDSEIQNYMRRLLQRVSGSQNADARKLDSLTADESQPHSSVPESSPPAAVAPDVQQAATQTAPQRVQAPESTSDLAVLRELANLNTQTALTKAQNRRYATAAVRELTLAIGTIAIGAIVFGTSSRLLSSTGLIGLIGLGTGIFMTARGIFYVFQSRPKPRTAKMSSKSRK